MNTNNTNQLGFLYAIIIINLISYSFLQIQTLQISLILYLSILQIHNA